MPQAAERLEVRLPWPDGGEIPARYTCDGAETAPRVRVAGATDERLLAVVMTDPDAPGGGFVHWTRWDGVEGENSFGDVGYGGPCPPAGDEPHRYVVTVYRLDRELGLKTDAAPEDVVAAIRERAVASGTVTATYGR